jgi:3-hydroxyphenylacetate 6-hydroxylase
MAIGSIVSASLGAAQESPLQFLAILVVFVPITYVVINEFVRRQARIPGMKGPSGIPLIGNIGQIRVNAAEKYREWAKTYGAVYQIQLGNIPVVVVNSAASAKVLFGQHAQALSSRPEFYTFHKVRLISPNCAKLKISHTKLIHRFFLTLLELPLEHPLIVIH